MKKPEILAPAGSMEALKAAVAAGCDAVYLGGNRFGARAFANNLDVEQMKEAIAYCHLRNVKIYLTVNTLLKERELTEGLYEYLLPYYEAGLDAVIVQDVGVIKYIHEHFPKLPIHASTQMTLTGGNGANFLKEYHVERIVPARELTIEELEQMRKDTDLELEVFVHGALCYCYSGQCLFSSMLGGRSGNRGRCAQPCRMMYSVEGEQASYILSPMELCNLSHIPELIEAGVDSFKIEGRMKRAEYTAFVTAMYRKYVDLYCCLGAEEYHNYLLKHKKEWEEDLRCLAELYNRNGFTQGYLEGKIGTIEKRHDGQTGTMLAKKRPKHGGVLVGKVFQVDAFYVTYEAILDISAQDVVEFRNDLMEVSYEYTLKDAVRKGEKITARYQKGCKIRKGDFVYRTKDARLLCMIQEKYFTDGQQGLEGTFTARLGEVAKLTLVFRGETIVQEGMVCTAAKNQSATKESVARTLNQTGTSEFYFETLKITLDDGLFLPVGALKQLRRDAFAQLKDSVLSKYYRTGAVSKTQAKQEYTHAEQNTKKRAFSASVMTKEQFEAVLAQSNVTRVYLCTEILSEAELTEAYHALHATGKEAWLVMPAVFRKGVYRLFEQARKRKESMLHLAWDGFVIKNMESYHFLKEKMGISMDKVRLDYNMYIMNSYSSYFWREQGISKWTLSLEATEKEMTAYDFLEGAELIVYGKTPLMTSAQCVYANSQCCQLQNEKNRNSMLGLEDAKGRKFEVVNYCKYCYNVIYQKEPVYIKEAAMENSQWNGVDFRYVFTTESKQSVKKILEGEMCEKVQWGHFNTGIE